MQFGKCFQGCIRFRAVNLKVCSLPILLYNVNIHGRLQNFVQGGATSTFCLYFQVADDVMQMDFHKTLSPLHHAWSRVLRFGGRIHFRGQDFLFTCLKEFYWAKHNLGTHKGIWGGTTPEYHPVATGRLSTPQKGPLVRLQSQKCASLAAIAKHIKM